MENDKEVTILENLSNREFHLMHDIKSVRGANREIESTLITKGVSRLYSAIFDQYTEINSNEEALRRAVFLQWYGVVEPFALTGLLALSENFQLKNIERIKALTELGIIEKETCVMLRHYFSVSDWYFNSFFDFTTTMDKIRQMGSRSSDLQIARVTGRGMMGAYWKSLEHNH